MLAAMSHLDEKKSILQKKSICFGISLLITIFFIASKNSFEKNF